MLDMSDFRENAEAIRADHDKRNLSHEKIDQVIQLDNEWREAIYEQNLARKERNEQAKLISEAKKKGDLDSMNQLLSDVKNLGTKIDELDEIAKKFKEKRDSIRMAIPNILHESVPIGDDETGNTLHSEHGEKPNFSFKPKTHNQLLEINNYLEYEKAIQSLGTDGLTYRCVCSRKTLPDGRYPGTCRELKINPNDLYNIRLKAPKSVQFFDVLYGKTEEDINHKHGDFVIKPRDRAAAYHLAVVVDDAKAGVSEVVRGADLLSSTPLQVYIYEKLGYPCPQFFHIPVVKNHRGVKLSKQTGANPIDVDDSKSALLFAIDFLGFVLPDSLRTANCARLLRWATYESNISILEATQSRFRDEMKNFFSSL